MDGVNAVRAPYAAIPPAQNAVKAATEKAGLDPAANTVSEPDNARLSPLARSLSDAAAHAAQRDASNDRQKLAAIAARATQPIHSPMFEQTKVARDTEAPNSDDLQRLEQARQATAYLNGKGRNPFQGMSQEQLSLISHDESGAFTVNERRAALVESYDQEQAWAQAVSKQLMDEYNRNGHFSSKTLQGILDYYKGLPAILEAQLIDSYETDLNRLIAYAEHGNT